ncbi:MAG: hypothetical protein AAF316_08160 [Cyanobacteria bacterium P01_A01_bin.80]
MRKINQFNITEFELDSRDCYSSRSASLGAAMIPSIAGYFASRFGLEVIPVLMIPLAVVMLILHRGMVRK